jgi:hypothetical protein
MCTGHGFEVQAYVTGARFELAISGFLFIAKKLITHSAMHMSPALYQAELPRLIFI